MAFSQFQINVAAPFSPATSSQMAFSQFQINVAAPFSPDTSSQMAFSQFQIDMPADLTMEEDAPTPAPAPTASQPAVPSARNLPKDYFTTRGGVFTAAQKEIVEQNCKSSASVVLGLLQQHDPNMPQTHKQVKGAVDNERRKKRRREGNGEWTAAERKIIADNIDKTPTAIKAVLKANTMSSKNVDQIRGMKQVIKTQVTNAGHWAKLVAQQEAAPRAQQAVQQGGEQLQGEGGQDGGDDGLIL